MRCSSTYLVGVLLLLSTIAKLGAARHLEEADMRGLGIASRREQWLARAQWSVHIFFWRAVRHIPCIQSCYMQQP